MFTWLQHPSSIRRTTDVPTRLRPSKIVCVGRNYIDHAKELGNDVPREPLLFLKPPSSLIGSGEAIVLPPQSQRVEHEAEIGLVIGERLRRVPPSETLHAVRGVVALNDVTARDLQRADSQWTRAKGFDTFCPVGNVAEGISNFAELTVIGRVNAVERQRGLAGDMVFDVATLLSYISRVMTLEPGDLVATGTPAGVGTLSPGDEVEVQIVGPGGVISSVRNPVTSES